MIHSILIIGQSNMAGRGNLNEAPQSIDKRLFVLRNGRWQPLYRPINNDRVFSGFCLAETFATCYAEDKNTNVGIIPCADGGTSIDQWQKGTLLYDNAVYQAKLAQRTSTIVGVLWHQGESDCADDKYPLYGEKLALLFNSLRKDALLCDIPFIVGGLGDFLPKFEESYKNYIYINEALNEYAKKNPLTAFVSAKGLKTKGDNLHFDTKSLMTFGERYYSAFSKIENKNRIFTEKNEADIQSRGKLENL